MSIEDAQRFFDELTAGPLAKFPAFPTPEAISQGEWDTSRLTPACIVKDLLFADVAVFVSPGGTGKTTLKLFEAVHIALGLPLYGLEICTPGSVLIITAEDSREMLIARLRSIAEAMMLSEADIAAVMLRVRIVDVSGNGYKLTEVRGEVVRPSAGIDLIIDACKALKPVLIVIDPAVSFSVGESRINDAEQGLVEAARKLRQALNCCVQYIHHSGKQNARDRTTDQYAGRGGSAFADGARMVHVLQPMTPDEWRNETGMALEDGESGLRLARPKISYCAPQRDILICRRGYHFQHVPRVTTSKEATLEIVANQVLSLLASEFNTGTYHTQRSLETLQTGLKRGVLRDAVERLLATFRVEYREMPNAGRGGKRQYLHPIAVPDSNGAPREKTNANDEIPASQESAFAAPPPIGNTTAAHQRHPFVSPSS